MNYSDILIPEKSLPNRVVNAAMIMGASWIVAISSQITIILPFSPVPITGQTLAVLLAGLILGKKLGTASIAAYLAQGAAGLPFFAGGKSGLATLLGPTGGYLFGFLAAAYIVGMLSELRFKRSLFQAFSAIVIGNMIIYVFGLVWLARFV
jgi:biotin transport system substrate-specific component